jgi:CRISPR/Cas system CMR-associated protein Cmr5 small subunit
LFRETYLKVKGVKMQNLNQIRARHVLEFAKVARVRGEVIKKIPPVIMNNGIMAALAFSMDKSQQAWRLVFDAISVHLSSKEISMIPEDRNSAEMLLDYLASEASSTMLRDITAEAGEWLNFARRLVK